MSWQPAKCNYDRVQYEALRRDVEAPFTEAHDAISAVWYNHWRQGDLIEVEVCGQRLQPRDEKDARAIFDAVHAKVELLRQEALDAANEEAFGTAKHEPKLRAAELTTDDAGVTVRQRRRVQINALRSAWPLPDLERPRRG